MTPSQLRDRFDIDYPEMNRQIRCGEHCIAMVKKGHAGPITERWFERYKDIRIAPTTEQINAHVDVLRRAGHSILQIATAADVSLAQFGHVRAGRCGYTARKNMATKLGIPFAKVGDLV
jgi:hypothetical protein